ncbi:hypothetical protein WICMUC_005483 [Wickerhamomyces mucosus]|uniref:Transcription factor IIIA n=1 Tax=Wickerhamomyces mucosus TaxID=1378264 RepID=A0A9P8T670_9ASCO|nr:hypothetical protein WICMUC_005483 [Wickerhamomyces mucosus]
MSSASESNHSPRGRSSDVPGTPLSSAPSSRASSSSSRPKIYACDYEGCNKAYSRPSLLTQHQRTHTDSRPFKCDICDRSFFRESHLKTHLISHSEEKPYKCSICGKGVNTKQHLKRHEITHTNSFECEYENCGETFHKHQQLRHHIQSVHLKTLTCDVCGKVFSRPYRLANHKTKHHGVAPAYQCDYPGCLNSFKTWSALQLHMKTDHPKLHCKVCNKGCVGEEGLRMHMMVHDSEKSIKLWKCTECPKEYSKKDDLIVHCKNDHGFLPNSLQQIEKAKEKPIVGEQDEQSKDKIMREDQVEKLISNGGSALDLLLNSVSSPQHTLPCPYKNCQRIFKKDYDLKRHLAWHEKQKNIFIARGLIDSVLLEEAEIANLLQVDEEINGDHEN